MTKYCFDELRLLHRLPFDDFSQEEKIDYLLLKNFLDEVLRGIELAGAQYEAMTPLMPFASTVIRLCEDRQDMKPVHGQKVAEELQDLGKQLVDIKEQIEKNKVKVDKFTAFRAGKTLDRLRSHLKEWYGFFEGYDPLFTWWVKLPYETVDTHFEVLATTVREKLVGIAPGEEDAIVGEPIGHDALVADLQAEKIAYSPEEIIRISEIEYEWCEKEMKKASMIWALQ